MIGPIKHAIYCTILVLVLMLPGFAADVTWTAILPAQWKGKVAEQVTALKRTAAAVIAAPAFEVSPLTVTSAQALPAGLYAVRLALRPSHVAGAVAFNSALRVKVGATTAAEFPGQFFARVHQPEFRVAQVVHPTDGPLTLRLDALTDAAVFKASQIDARSDNQMPGDDDDLLGGGDEPLGLNPNNAVYYLVDVIEYRPLSRSGRVLSVACDRIRYQPGATLKGTAVVQDLTGNGGQATLNLYLEHALLDRVKVKSLPVTLAPQPQTLVFDVPLPKEELGYALVAEFVSADGADHSEAAEYFTIAENFQRVAIFGGGMATRDAVLDEDTIRQDLVKARREYFNATEYFAWAEDDRVEMSPEKDFWSSGQTNYRMNKQTLQRQIRLAHEQGFAVSTYGKNVMSGLPGWQLLYDYPNDHRGQYNYHVGMWAGVSVPQFDRRRDGDFRVYSKGPNISGNTFNTWWAGSLFVGSDVTPRMVRLSAEEVIRSIDMFGWDAIRWDDHFRGAFWAQCGRSGNYQPWAARQTQSYMRYFKDLVAAKCPNFQHGYNYLLIEQDKTHDWAVEDFELDELCRGGGLLMNESIGNASAGWTFAQIARNLQVDGDLCRERGGCYLGISFAMSPRDILIESALWAAAGCRPYNTAMSRETRRYCTRYAQYTFDEQLRRLAMPEKILQPQAATKLWWQPFVYETPLQGGKRQLVVNLLNLPLQEKRPNNRGETPKPVWTMPPGTDPVTFTLTLPAGMRATAVRLIDPQTLAVTPLPVKDNRLDVPAVAIWQVAVIDLAVEAGAPSLASLYGAPKTLGVQRAGLKETDRKPDVVLDPTATFEALTARVAVLAPEWDVKSAQQQAAFNALTGPAREQALLARRQTPEALAKEWWEGAGIPADLALKDKRPTFGDLTPVRNGRFDIFYGRGAMDYRLKIPEAFARLDRFTYHDAGLNGAVQKGSGGAWLQGNVPGQRYADFDVLLFTSIPHNAIGIDNSYVMVDYVKAGGAVFFTGGEYAFGKGGYMHTVLERELLPFLCAGMQDTAYTQEPKTFEPGPDYADLQVTLDFTARPAYWVRNEAILKPGAKVFLKSGEVPILVGWQVGKGRVACLLLDHRGKSGDGVTAFFDWPDWPRLVAAVLRWLAPDAGINRVPPTPAVSTEAIRQLEKEADNDEMSAATDAILGDGPEQSNAENGEGAVTLNDAALKKRLLLIEQALNAGGAPAVAVLARHLAIVSNLPQSLRWRLLTALRTACPANAAPIGHKALLRPSGVLHGCGFMLLALAGDPAFVTLVKGRLSTLEETQDTTLQRQRDLNLAVALYPKPDLVDEGRRRVESWNRQEAAIRANFAQVCGADTDMLETSPCLDADALFARVCWLAYLSRYDPQTYGVSFVREWLRCAQYQDYCGRTLYNLQNEQKVKSASVLVPWQELSDRFGILQQWTRADVEAVMTKAPVQAAAGFSQTRFSSEVRVAINLLGQLPRETTAPVLERIGKGAHQDLTAFVAARRGAK